ncbi:hypothetical protein [Nocardia sp. alder85J]|uniref:hypothetical protein n=1 Tax=Nocardia sp. alder85J TaxID=2862949 RepID=UPI001CD4095E|nr:hypothetical protein [Nocardia sp. alder85J]MCX4095337.1 hypothetical protein [Nocardia sp. alder85J]
MQTGIPTAYTETPLIVDAQPQQSPTEYVQPVMPGAQFLNAPSVNDTTTVGRAQASLEAVGDQFDKWLRTIKTDDYSPDGLRARISEFATTPAGKTIDAVMQTTEQLRDSTKADLERVQRELSPDGDTAQELRNTRYWNRAQRQLDAAKDGVAGAAVALLRHAEPAELGVLLQELPSYLRSRGVSFDASTKAILAEKAPQYARALKRAVDAEQAYEVTRHNVQQMRSRLSVSHPGAYQKPFLVDARKYDPDR